MPIRGRGGPRLAALPAPLKRPVTETHHPPPSEYDLPPNVATFVADRLEEEILDGRRAPGSPLLQLDLVAEFGVSRVPVRDALALLEQRHLAVRLPRKGVIVRPVTPRSVRAVFAARRLLEAEITRLAVHAITDGDLATLEAIVERQRAAGDLRAVRAADRDFHATIWRACGNEVLEELVETVWRRALQARSVGHRTPGWSEKSLARHERIVQALRRRDAQAAVAAAVDAVDGAEAEILAQLGAPESGPAESGPARGQPAAPLASSRSGATAPPAHPAPHHRTKEGS
ncbi:MAG TPA: GntR family transcriptional regulator [Chloroflexota bacterium]|nr:GntR family transcriptional regulator [Chloroflexota bacterium]